MKRALLTACYVLFACVLTFAQTRQLTGKVIGPDNQGVVSATVKVKGSNNATSTNADGVFSLKVPSGNITLQITSVGFSAKEVSVSGSESTISVSLVGDATQLQDVVVTVMGISKQSKKLGYAVTTVNNEALSKARETNVASSLSGRVAGLKVAGTNSGPQGTVKLLLRGNPSMNSSGAPLFVINGVPMDNSQRGGAGEWGGTDNGDGIGNLNPDDIENMTVLKGQSASALYGSRASNGVILITTKTGKKNDFSVDYNMNYMEEHAIDYTDFQYTYGQGLGGAKPATVASAQQNARMSWGAKLDGVSTIQFDGNSYPYSAVKDNTKNFYRSGPSLTNTVALSKGGANGSFRLSMSNLNSNSIVRNSGLTRNTVNLNTTQDITDKLNVSMFASYLDQNSTGVPYLSDGPLNPNNGQFLATNIDQKILSPGYDKLGNETVFSDDIYVSNPWFVVNKIVNTLGRRRFTTSNTIKYNFEKWLYSQVRVGYDVENDRSLSVTPWGTAYSAAGKGGLNNLGQSTRYEFNVDAMIGGSHDITEDLSIDAAIGGNLRKNKFEAVSVSGSPFILPYLYSFNNVTNYGRGYGFSQIESHSGYYTADLSYKNYLTVGTTGRYDAYSTLPTNNNTIFVPSVSTSFIFSELIKPKFLSYGKLRASYAKTSNELTNPYQTRVYYSLANSYLGTPVGSFNTSLPSGLLKPFTTTELEFGTELRFFGSRLTFDAAYFTKKTQNEIMSASYSIATGYTSGFVPTGSVQNKGLELQIGGTPIRTKDFNWTSTLNITSVQNKILSTGPTNGRLGLGQTRGALGNAITAYVVGLAGPQIMAYDYKRDAKGSIIVDAAGLPVQGAFTAQGSVLPTLYGGWNNEFSYKDFTFSFLIDYNYGNKVLSATSYYSLVRGLNQATLEGRETGVTKGVTAAGATNTVAATAQAYHTAVAQRITSSHVLDGDFIKLRQVSLGYNLPQSYLKGLKIIQSAQISLVGRNLLCLMKKTDNIDPEATFGSSINYYGIEGTNLPSTRSYGVNVNIKFKK